MRSIVACCLILTIPAFVFGTEIVVDPGGGGDATTIQDGLDLAEAGDVVLVAPGIYHEDIVMKSGVELASRSGADVTTIDPGGVEGILCERCEPGTRIIGFTLTNGGGYSGGAVRLFDNSHVEVAHCIIEDNHSSYESSGVHVQQSCFAHVHDNVFRNNVSLHSVCISVIVGSEAVVEDNLFMHNTSTHLSAGVGVHSSHCYLRGNVFFENVSVNGSAVRSWSGSIQLKNNTFIRNSSVTEAADVSAFNGSQLSLERNLFADPVAGPAVWTTSYPETSCNMFWGYETYVIAPEPVIGQDGNVIEDPLLCLLGQEKGALSEFSPCFTGPCAVVGANSDPGCQDQVPTRPMSWGDVKSLYH